MEQYLSKTDTRRSNEITTYPAYSIADLVRIEGQRSYASISEKSYLVSMALENNQYSLASEYLNHVPFLPLIAVARAHFPKPPVVAEQYPDLKFIHPVHILATKSVGENDWASFQQAARLTLKRSSPSDRVYSTADRFICDAAELALESPERRGFLFALRDFKKTVGANP